MIFKTVRGFIVNYYCLEYNIIGRGLADLSTRNGLDWDDL